MINKKGEGGGEVIPFTQDSESCLGPGVGGAGFTCMAWPNSQPRRGVGETTHSTLYFLAQSTCDVERM